ncbi:MAG: T4SS-associated protein EirA [Gammaproteobacteria bacterium]
MISKTILILILLFFGVTGFAATEPTNTATSDAGVWQVPVAGKEYMCPNVQDLTRQNLRWASGDGKWTSFSESFSSTLEVFLGAQWMGVRVGKIICLYKGKGSFDFPVALETSKHTLVLDPLGKTWKQEKKGLKTCMSYNVADCAFTVVEKDNDVGRAYENIKYHGNAGAVDNDSL